jgi:hypothetical protein
VTAEEKTRVIERLEKLSQKLDGAIGRLVLLRGDPRGREAHEIAIAVGTGLTDVINELQESGR